MTHHMTAAETLEAVVQKKKHITDFSRAVDGIARRHDRAATALRQVARNPEQFGATAESVAAMQQQLEESRRSNREQVELARHMTAHACGEWYAAVLAAQSERAAG